METVVKEFFVLEEDGWHNKRCDQEIARFRESQPDREAKRDNERERQRKTRERRKHLFDALRSAGVVPAYDTPMSELQRLASQITSQPVTPPVTRDATATQTPDTRHHISLPDGRDKRAVRAQAVACPQDVDPQVWDDWCQLRKTKRATVTATVVEGARREAQKAGIPLTDFLATWCTRGSQGLQAAWLKPEETRAEAASSVLRGLTRGLVGGHAHVKLIA